MAGVQPAMLWEAADASAALARRFRFGSAAEVETWLRSTVHAEYGISVRSMDRLAISSYNFLAWLQTSDGPLIAKCCGWAPAHAKLLRLAALLAWLEEEGLHVVVPLMAASGVRQVLIDGRSLGILRVVKGELLDALQPEQARAAGTMLARLHRVLAAYPHAAEIGTPTPPALAENIKAWVAQKGLTAARGDVAAGSRDLLALLAEQTLPPLPAQLVHHDFRAANLIWDGEKIAAVLDFEELSWGCRVEDFAWAAVHLGTLFHAWGPVPQAVHELFIAAYAAELPLAAAEETWLPILLHWHSLDLARK